MKTLTSISGESVAPFMYGTAWKEERTEGLTRAALKAGFRALDTANQRKHYFEAGVGAAVQTALREGWVRREELFLQTKFTFRGGQDHRLPYDPAAPFEEQVRRSFESSLEHLGVERLDSYVLHGPSSREGIVAADREVWRAMETLHGSGRVRFLGVSNVSAAQLASLIEHARTAPAFVQNRCYARFAWDERVRGLCADHGITYQGFSLLTANRQTLTSAAVQTVASKRGMTPAQLVFRYALDLGMLPLTGTSDPTHMAEDLMVLQSAPLDDEARRVVSLAEL